MAGRRSVQLAIERGIGQPLSAHSILGARAREKNVSIPRVWAFDSNQSKEQFVRALTANVSFFSPFCSWRPIAFVCVQPRTGRPSERLSDWLRSRFWLATKTYSQHMARPVSMLFIMHASNVWTSGIIIPYIAANESLHIAID